MCAIEYSYKNWKNNSDLNLVCEKLLDNANVDIIFTNFPFSVSLIFFVIGSDIKVTFICSEIESFHLDKGWDDSPLYVVLETNVKAPKKNRHLNQPDHEFSCMEHDGYLWEINVMPDVNLNIKCLSFEWRIDRVTEKEVALFNAG
ncbi:hypothetical protein N474_21360 [Pseudoalteromonas luteoviolacea CPMOR-2]|uniref:Uncharacterized protein n=1 Tax=Pseudoalteromonas luteoviolacea DSM 6061 TaxID=1365250 RepID=A0A166U9J3_9GAMM|nr:hypothetical protein [Pseudoalteromonas luteoviolacea]KZN29702.1 hypothetical protein N475_05235 [Pseudoalteromonas luteoviolacea DSM 6061]KZN53261.1 hypothetical protein N474_21360 [Pseudoalteromonas luteoviolacea CPMOR-2]MBE0389407.1 hypothetical protein [Pseudoalteromonas luteoviolacea DSM 6061]